MPYHVGTSGECPASKPHAVIKDSDGKVMGCHESKESAQRQIAAIHANEGAAVTTVTLAVNSPNVTGDGYGGDVSFMSGTPWEGVLAMEDVETGDGRMFSPGAITWADLPIPLRWNMEDSHGGQPTTKAVLVGRIDKVWRDPENPMKIMGAGVFDDGGVNGAEALRLVHGKFLKGISVDPDDIKDADVELVFPEGSGGGDEMDQLMDLFAPPELTIFHAGRLRGATLVDIPAFVEAGIWLVDPATVPQAVTAASHFHDLSDRQWNGAENEVRIGQLTKKKARRAYAHVAAGLEQPDKTSVRFLHHEIGPDGEPELPNLTACSIGIRFINSGRAANLTDAERRLAYEHMAEHLRSAGLTPSPYEGGEVLVAAGFDDLEKPPVEWFQNPQFDRLTPLTVSDEGRVYGHGAEWGTCHMSFGNTCVRPPHEPNGEHAYYRLGEVMCADGSRVAVGAITLGTGHAPTKGISASQAAEHYDNTGTVVALVATGEDDFGIWINGYVKPGTPMKRVAELQAAGKVSGDWRRIGGSLRLVAFLAVNVPGFPVPRLSTFSSRGQQRSLVAAGIITQHEPIAHTPALDAAMARIARTIGRDPESRMNAIRARVKG